MGETSASLDARTAVEALFMALDFLESRLGRYRDELEPDEMDVLSVARSKLRDLEELLHAPGD